MTEDMREFWVLFGVFNAVDLFNFILHATGIHLLYRLHLKNKESTQTLYILNLASTEMTQSLMNILYKISYALYILFPNLESHFYPLVNDVSFLMSGTNYTFYFVLSDWRSINAVIIPISISSDMDC